MFRPVIHRFSVLSYFQFDRRQAVLDKVPADVNVGRIQPVVVD